MCFEAYANHRTRHSSPTRRPSDLFKRRRRFLPALPTRGPQPGPQASGRAGYYIRADKGDWVLQSARHGDQDYFTWINKGATTVWLFAVPHNVDLDDNAAIQAAIDELMDRPLTGFDSELYMPTDNERYELNGQLVDIGYKADVGKNTAGYK